MQMTAAGPYSVSIERKDSSKGYTKENIVLCISAINTMKNDLTTEEFYFIIQQIVQHY